MRIAIDLRIAHAQKTGIGVYANCLAKHLLAIDEANVYHDIILHDQIVDFPVDHANLSFWLTRVSGKHRLLRELWEFIYLPWKLRTKRIDVYHGPNNVIPFWANCAMVVTIHDLNAFLFSDTNSKLSLWRWKPLIWLSAKKATLIITDSNSTKNDVISILNVSAERVRVVYLALDEKVLTYKRQEDIVRKTREKYRLRDRFVLFVGALNPRKNLVRLLEAFDILSRQIAHDHQLVIAGKKGWLYDDIFRAVKRLNLEDKVVFTGYVEDRDLPALYSAASLTVYPSMYEGFGFPILESMACGTPVVAANVSSIPEVADEAAILVNPTDVAELARAMHLALTDANLRQSLIRKGLERVRNFSWQETAHKTLEVYQEAYEIWQQSRRRHI